MSVLCIYVRKPALNNTDGNLWQTGGMFRMARIDVEAYWLVDILSHCIIYYHFKWAFVEVVHSDQTCSQAIKKLSVAIKYSLHETPDDDQWPTACIDVTIPQLPHRWPGFKKVRNSLWISRDSGEVLRLVDHVILFSAGITCN